MLKISSLGSKFKTYDDKCQEELLKLPRWTLRNRTEGTGRRGEVTQKNMQKPLISSYYCHQILH